MPDSTKEPTSPPELLQDADLTQVDGGHDPTLMFSHVIDDPAFDEQFEKMRAAVQSGDLPIGGRLPTIPPIGEPRLLERSPISKKLEDRLKKIQG